MYNKALVIQGTDFSGVALDHVTLLDEVHCTGISLNYDELTFTSLSPQTLIPTISPVDTTDDVLWSSSDTSVCVVSNGVVTPIKSGTAIITATCGNYSATCDVEATITVTLENTFGVAYAYSVIDNAVPLVSGEGYACTQIDDGSGRHCYDPSSFLTPGTNFYPIILPANATKVNVDVPESYMKVTFQFVDTEQDAQVSGASDIAKRISGDSSPWDGNVSGGDRTVNVPSGANAVFISVQQKTSQYGAFTQEEAESIVVTVDL